MAKRVDRGIGLNCAAVVNSLIIPPGTSVSPRSTPHGTRELPPTYTGTAAHVAVSTHSDGTRAEE
ncbi:hypothetical protein GCM10026982_60180 [Nocardiopsis aegyptia]